MNNAQPEMGLHLILPPLKTATLGSCKLKRTLLSMTPQTAIVTLPNLKRTLLSMIPNTATLMILNLRSTLSVRRVHLKPGSQSFMLRLIKSWQPYPQIREQNTS